MALEIGGFSWGGLNNAAAQDAQAGDQYRALLNQFGQQYNAGQQHTQSILAQAAAEAGAQNQANAKQQQGMDALQGQSDQRNADIARQQQQQLAQQAFQEAQAQAQQTAE